MTRPFNHLLNGELCQWGTPSLHWSHEEQLSLWKEDYQQLAAALNKSKDATTKNKYASSLKFLKAAKVTSRECMIRDRDEDGRPIGDQRRVGYVEIMLTGKDAEYWNGDSTPPPAQEEWAMHICQPDLLPHFITGKWDSGRKYNEIFIFEVTDPGKPIDLNKEEAPYTSDNFVSSPRRLRAVLEDCARKCFGSQDHGQILPFHNIPKAVLIVAHQPRVDNDVLNTIDRGAAEQWPKRHLKNGDWDGGPTSKKAPRVRPVAVLLAAPSAGQQQLARALREQMREKYSDGTYALAQYCLGILPDAVHGSNQWDSLWLQRRQEPLEAIQAEPRKEIESIVECLRLLWLSGMQKRDTWRRYPGLNFRAGKFAPIPRWFRKWLEDYARSSSTAINLQNLGEFLRQVGDQPRSTADARVMSRDEEDALKQTPEFSRAREALEEAIEEATAALDLKREEIEKLHRQRRKILQTPGQQGLAQLLEDLAVKQTVDVEEALAAENEHKRQLLDRRAALVEKGEKLKTVIKREEKLLKGFEALRAERRDRYLGETPIPAEMPESSDEENSPPPQPGLLRPSGGKKRKSPH